MGCTSSLENKVLIVLDRCLELVVRSLAVRYVGSSSHLEDKGIAIFCRYLKVAAHIIPRYSCDLLSVSMATYFSVGIMEDSTRTLASRD